VRRENAYNIPVIGSAAEPPQFAPPSSPGMSMVLRVLGGVKYACQNKLDI